jgi:hypothetical protein
MMSAWCNTHKASTKIDLVRHGDVMIKKGIRIMMIPEGQSILLEEPWIKQAASFKEETRQLASLLLHTKDEMTNHGNLPLLPLTVQTTSKSFLANSSTSLLLRGATSTAIP